MGWIGDENCKNEMKFDAIETYLELFLKRIVGLRVGVEPLVERLHGAYWWAICSRREGVEWGGTAARAAGSFFEFEFSK